MEKQTGKMSLTGGVGNFEEFWVCVCVFDRMNIVENGMCPELHPS